MIDTSVRPEYEDQARQARTERKGNPGADPLREAPLMCWLGAGRPFGVEGTEDALGHHSGRRPVRPRAPATLTPCQVVGQLAATRMRTSAAVCGKPKPTRH